MEIIAITSFKGGTAKTSTSLHIGAAMAKYHNKKVLLVDFDAQANMSTGLGFNPDEQDSLVPVLQKTKSIEKVIQKTCLENMDIIPGDTWLERVEVTDALAADRYSHERLKDILNNYQHYDVVIIDTPPSLCWLTESALIAANHSLICATPEFYSIKGLQRLAHFIESIGKRHPLNILGVTLSFWNYRGKSNKAFLEFIEGTFPGKALQNKIRRDISISEASIYGKPVFETSPNSRGAKDYRNLTKEIVAKLN